MSRTHTSLRITDLLVLLMMTSFSSLKAKGKKLERIIGTCPPASSVFFRFYSVGISRTATIRRGEFSNCY
jgi:hypothetical protein